MALSVKLSTSAFFCALSACPWPIVIEITGIFSPYIPVELPVWGFESAIMLVFNCRKNSDRYKNSSA
jgi:hypothetical protein